MLNKIAKFIRIQYSDIRIQIWYSGQRVSESLFIFDHAPFEFLIILQ